MISMDKQYRTRDGREVRILTTSRKHNKFPVTALISNEDEEQILSASSTGEYYPSSDITDHRDLIEITPYDHINKGELVMIWNERESYLEAALRKFHKAINIEVYTKPVNELISPSWDHCLTVQEYADKYL